MCKNNKNGVHPQENAPISYPNPKDTLLVVDSSLYCNVCAISISENKPSTTAAFKQAQTHVVYSLPGSVNLCKHIAITINSKNEHQNIVSCIKTGNILVFTDCLNKRLIICNSNGAVMHHMTLSYKPYYITEIESDSVAVSCLRNRTVLLINISTRSVTRTINTSGVCWGLSYIDDHLYVVIDKSVIHVMDLTSKLIRTIHLPANGIQDITVERDRLICINKTSIYCFSLGEKLMWKFEKEKLKDFRTVTTDNEGNVYVTDPMTHTVVVISDNGNHYREILTKSDGMDWPYGIHFDKKEKILCVCNNSDGQAFLFDVKGNQHK